MDWFLYDNGPRHERVNLVRQRKMNAFPLLIKDNWKFVIKLSLYLRKSSSKCKMFVIIFKMCVRLFSYGGPWGPILI